MGNRELERAFSNGYEEIYGRPTPIRYDVLKLSDEHRKLDALLRRYYDLFHPLVKDLFTSFALEFQYLLTEMEKIEEEGRALKEEYDTKNFELENEAGERFTDLKKKTEDLEQKFNSNQEERAKLQEAHKKLTEELDAKTELIITQRKELDDLIDQSTHLKNLKSEQQETIYGTIEHVSKFTARLENIEKEMGLLQRENKRLKDENNSLTLQHKKKENQFENNLGEISDVYKQLRKEFAETEKIVQKIQNQKLELKKKLQIKEEDQKDLTFRVEQLQKNNRSLHDEIDSLQLLLESETKDIIALSRSEKQSKRESHETTKSEMITKPNSLKISKKELAPLVEVKTVQKKKTSLEMELEKEEHIINEKNFDDDTLTSKLFTQDHEQVKIKDIMKNTKPEIKSLNPEISTGNLLEKVIRGRNFDEISSVEKLKSTLEKTNVQDTSGSNLDKMMKHLNSTETTEIQDIDLPRPPQRSSKTNIGKKRDKKTLEV